MRPRLISVVIPCHGGIDDTRACIASMHEQVEASPIEIIVVNNASPDATGLLHREFASVRVLEQATNLGFAGGVNAGIEAARGDLCLVLNNDTMAAPHMLAELECALASDPRIAIAAPTSNLVKGTARVDVGTLGETAADRVEIEAILADHSQHAPLQDVDTLSGLCMLARRSTLIDCGAFDPRFGAGMFEDDDLSLRLRLLGNRLVVARRAFLFHRGHRTFQRIGEDVGETMNRRLATFRDKWLDDPAGRVYIARLAGDLGTAAQHAGDAARRYPNWSDAQFVLAQAARNRHDFDATVRHASRFIEQTPSHGRGQLLRGIGLIGVGRSGEGLDVVRRALSTCWFAPDELASALADVGRLHIELERHADAIGFLRDAHELDPEYADHANLLGLALLETGSLEEAQQLFELASRADDPAALNNLGICAWRTGDPRGAIRSFERACELAPDNASYRSNLNAAQAGARAVKR